MIYLVRCIDYVEHPREANPLSEKDINAFDYGEARIWFNRWAEEYQRPDCGRHVSIARLDDGITVEEIDQPPCDDNNAEDPDADDDTTCDDEPGGSASEALDFLNIRRR